MPSEDPLRVGIDARIVTGTVGGVESVVLGLAHGLSQLTDGSEEYVFITYEGHDSWIRRHVSGPCHVTSVPYPTPRESRIRDIVDLRAPRLLASVRAVKRMGRRLMKRDALNFPVMDGTFEAIGVKLVHFPFQRGFLTELPSIYHPHDLQHRHLPQFFSTAEYRHRERAYRALCHDSSMVAVASEWVRDDVIAAYGLPRDKVVVVPLAPAVDVTTTPSSDQVSQVRSHYGLPAQFILYPAATWPHKNHLRLIEALATLRERSIKIPLVCTGMLTGHHEIISQHIERLQLADQVRFLGFVPPNVIESLYASARAVVIPTEYEAASFPMWEAFRKGVPVACSDVTSLPEQAGDAAILFDPHDEVAIASSVERLWTDDQLRSQLVERGHTQVARFDWITTARTFRAHYRRIAGRAMSEEDVELLASSSSLGVLPRDE